MRGEVFAERNIQVDIVHSFSPLLLLPIAARSIESGWTAVHGQDTFSPIPLTLRCLSVHRPGVGRMISVFGAHFA